MCTFVNVLDDRNQRLTRQALPAGCGCHPTYGDIFFT